MDTKKYLVREGVDWINGARVPADRIVALTDAEALYDKGLGRIEPLPAKAGSRKTPKGEEKSAESAPNG